MTILVALVGLNLFLSAGLVSESSRSFSQLRVFSTAQLSRIWWGLSVFTAYSGKEAPSDKVSFRDSLKLFQIIYLHA